MSCKLLYTTQIAKVTWSPVSPIGKVNTLERDLNDIAKAFDEAVKVRLSPFDIDLSPDFERRRQSPYPRVRLPQPHLPCQRSPSLPASSPNLHLHRSLPLNRILNFPIPPQAHQPPDNCPSAKHPSPCRPSRRGKASSPKRKTKPFSLSNRKTMHGTNFSAAPKAEEGSMVPRSYMMSWVDSWQRYVSSLVKGKGG